MTPARPRPARVVLIGHPVAHSRSYIFQDAALRAAGIPLEYGSVDVPPESLASVLNELKAQGAAGNVTIPHKEAVAEACDRLTPIAERVRVLYALKRSNLGALTDVDQGEAARRMSDYAWVRRELIDAEREALDGLRRAGTIDEDMRRRVERDLDHQEVRWAHEL